MIFFQWFVAFWSRSGESCIWLFWSQQQSVSHRCTEEMQCMFFFLLVEGETELCTSLAAISVVLFIPLRLCGVSLHCHVCFRSPTQTSQRAPGCFFSSPKHFFFWGGLYLTNYRKMMQEKKKTTILTLPFFFYVSAHLCTCWGENMKLRLKIYQGHLKYFCIEYVETTIRQMYMQLNNQHRCAVWKKKFKQKLKKKKWWISVWGVQCILRES